MRQHMTQNMYGLESGGRRLACVKYVVKTGRLIGQIRIINTVETEGSGGSCAVLAI